MILRNRVFDNSISILLKFVTKVTVNCGSSLVSFVVSSFLKVDLLVEDLDGGIRYFRNLKGDRSHVLKFS